MRLVSWNMFTVNPKPKKGLRFIAKKDPDIICLQEVPHNHLKDIKRIFVGYKYFKITDSRHNKTVLKNNYIVTLSKHPFVSVDKLHYGSPENYSILNRILYQMLQGHTEMNNALITKIKVNKKIYSIYNLRLSCAVRPGTKQKSVNKLFGSIEKTKNTIVTGDFNLSGNWLWIHFTGWTKGYLPFDYLRNELGEFYERLRKSSFTNITEGINTNLISLKRMQYGTILLRKSMNNYKLKIGKRFYSDHRMLEVEIAH